MQLLAAFRDFNFFCLTQATTKDIKDSLGKQWTQLSDKKRLKWITKSLEQQKQYEVRQESVCGCLR